MGQNFPNFHLPSSILFFRLPALCLPTLFLLFILPSPPLSSLIFYHPPNYLSQEIFCCFPTRMGAPKLSFRLLPPDWPSLGSCKHLGREAENRRSFSICFLVFFGLYISRKVKMVKEIIMTTQAKMFTAES